jgi:hypothetical protein
MANIAQNDNELVQLPIPSDISAWYQSQLISHHGIGHLFPRWAVNSLYDPKIFHVLKPQPAYQFAAIDAWIRMMWRRGGLDRWMREAIAVTVSLANQCVY